MADPAVEAGNRVFKQFSELANPTQYTVTAAREALKPIRELHKPYEIEGKSCRIDCEEHEDPDDCPDVKFAVCHHCYSLALEANDYYGEEEGIGSEILWPCETAKLIYTTEELAQ
ncbi:hypothetical protein ACNQR9_25760 [Mycolicibacterium peregrinum]